jgi:hypothetical protein
MYSIWGKCPTCPTFVMTHVHFDIMMKFINFFSLYIEMSRIGWFIKVYFGCQFRPAFTVLNSVLISKDEEYHCKSSVLDLIVMLDNLQVYTKREYGNLQKSVVNKNNCN